MTNQDIATAGHNLPPSERERVKLEYKEYFDQGEKLETALKATPENIDGDELAAQVSDNLRSATKWSKKMDALRKEAGEPLKLKISEINAAFNNAVEPVEKAMTPVAERHEAYLKRKRDEEVRRLEEKAKAARLEAERQQREADAARLAKEAAQKAEAEAKAKEERAKREREEQDRRAAAAKAAQEAAEKAEREAIERRLEQERKDRVECDTKLEYVRSALAEAERLFAADRTAVIDTAIADLVDQGGVIDQALQFVRRRIDVLNEPAKSRCARYVERRGLFQGEFNQRRAEDARKANAEAEAKREAERQERLRLQRERDEIEAAEREARRKADEDAAEEARQRRAKAEQDERDAKAAAKAARADEREAVADQKGAAREQKAAGRIVRKAEDEGGRAEEQADKIDRKLDAAPGEMVQVRGDYGAIGTLARRWKVEIVNLEELDLEKLRHLIHPDALQAAAWRFMQAGGRDLRGAIIKQVEDGRVI